MLKIIFQPILNSATAGLELAAELMPVLARCETVEVNLVHVERMTPSFANAFMMTLLERHPRMFLRQRLLFLHARPHVTAALHTAVQRWEQGIRLSTQPPVMAINV